MAGLSGVRRLPVGASDARGDKDCLKQGKQRDTGQHDAHGQNDTLHDNLEGRIGSGDRGKDHHQGDRADILIELGPVASGGHPIDEKIGDDRHYQQENRELGHEVVDRKPDGRDHAAHHRTEAAIEDLFEAGRHGRALRKRRPS